LGGWLPGTTGAGSGAAIAQNDFPGTPQRDSVI
jgi:hypothetical protein